jgi:diguanylate cyclase (GGDEF)-like protein
LVAALLLTAAGYQAVLSAWPDQGYLVSNLGMVTVLLGGVVVHVRTARRSTGFPRRLWTVAALGLANWLVAQVMYGYAELTTGAPAPHPTAADVPNLLAFVLATASMLMVPTAPATWAGRLRMVLDGMIITSSLFGVAWILILGRLFREAESTFQGVVTIGYPTVSVIVLSIALLLLAGDRRWGRTALTFACAGITASASTLLYTAFLVLGRSPDVAFAADGGFLLAALLFAAAPFMPVPEGDARSWDPVTTAGRALPYLPVVLVTIGGGVEQVNRGRVDGGLVWCGIVLVLAVLGRQFLTLQVNAALTGELEQQRERLAHEAFHDRLTGLPNRAMITDRLTLECADGRSPALLLVDLDGFKAVNDTLGHTAGDELLVAVARRLRAVTVGAAVTARLGGDEFAVLLLDEDRSAAVRLAEQVLGTLAVPVQLTDRAVTVRGSVGIALDGQADRLLRDADVALYAAKAQGKGCYRIFDPQLHADTVHRMQIEAELAQALADDQFTAVYQPIVDLATHRITGVEALLRWRHPVRGLLTPDKFLAVAEQAGLLAACDRWILGHACRQVQQWRAEAPELAVSVNVSAAYLTGGTLVDDVAAALSGSGLPSEALTLEVTETVLVGDVELAASVLGELRGLGVRIALDDFGVGYSSLSYLRALPIDVVKIDKSFLRDPDPTLTAALLTFIQTLRLDHVAEGVEEAAQASWLHALHCRRAQGYFFARPLPPEQVRELLDGAETRLPRCRTTAEPIGSH